MDTEEAIMEELKDRLECLVPPLEAKIRSGHGLETNIPHMQKLRKMSLNTPSSGTRFNI